MCTWYSGSTLLKKSEASLATASAGNPATGGGGGGLERIQCVFFSKCLLCCFAVLIWIRMLTAACSFKWQVTIALNLNEGYA